MEIHNYFSPTFLITLTILFCENAKAASSKDTRLKIIDGSEVTPHALPYMVAIRTNIDGRSVLCGGSLISRTSVLTAATCLYGASEAEVILGAHNLTEKENTQVSMKSSEFIIHEKYTNESKTHDIALISLPWAPQLNDYISPIELPLPSDGNNYDEQEGMVAGWGKTSDTNNRKSDVLRAANLTIIPVMICGISHAFQINSDQMCTSGVSKKNICLGDAGSPLVVDEIQVGIASYGTDFGCGVGFPGVYTRVSSYLSWLGVTPK